VICAVLYLHKVRKVNLKLFLSWNILATLLSSMDFLSNNVRAGVLPRFKQLSN